MEEYKILKDLVGFNTIKDNQNKEIISYIEKCLKGLNFKTEYKGKILIMSIGENPKLGFLGHTDTVEYIDGWKSNPFELTKEDKKLYGLGVADMKGGIAAMLDAIKQIDFSKLKYGMKMYLTYDEEIDFGGIKELNSKNEKFPPNMIFGEPTNNEILVGSKGLLAYELYFKGIKAHSSNPAKGKNANLNAIKFLTKLDEFYNNKIKTYIENDFEIPYTTINIGIIDGGSGLNSVAANCKVGIDFRIANDKHIKIIKEEVEKLSKQYECEINIIEELESFIDKDIKYIDKIKTANFLTEASLVKRTNRMILGVGPITAHEVNEHITEESYKKLVEQYKDLINKICT